MGMPKELRVKQPDSEFYWLVTFHGLKVSIARQNEAGEALGEFNASVLTRIWWLVLWLRLAVFLGRVFQGKQPHG